MNREAHQTMSRNKHAHGYHMPMQVLTELAMAKAPCGIFTRHEAAQWLGGSYYRQRRLFAQAIAGGELLRIHRGLYCVAPHLLPNKVNPLALAYRIHEPSYISIEMAMSYHGMIPEAVYTITSVSQVRSREFATPLGQFSFTRIPQKTFYAEVSRIEAEDGSWFMLASPLKALADYVYAHKLDWTSAHPVIESLRVEEGSLADIRSEAFDGLEDNYSSRHVRRFLEGLRRDLKQ